MRILGLDTALGACSAALMIGGRIIAREQQTRSRGHAEVLVPMVQTVLAAAGLTIPELDRIAVTVGPGTFTGVRIGLAAARGFGLAGGVALVGVTTCAALAAGAARQLPPDPAWSHITVLIDARRGGIYRQAFRRCPRAPLVEAIGRPALVPVEDGVAAARMDAPTVLIGSAARAVFECLEGDRGGDGHPVACPDIAGQPRAEDVALLGALARPAPPDRPPAPLYLRPPDAKLPGALPTARALPTGGASIDN